MSSYFFSKLLEVIILIFKFEALLTLIHNPSEVYEDIEPPNYAKKITKLPPSALPPISSVPTGKNLFRVINTHTCLTIKRASALWSRQLARSAQKSLPEWLWRSPYRNIYPYLSCLFPTSSCLFQFQHLDHRQRTAYT